MARKSIKGYAEKNYYDNTRFSGGIVATNDPLNEGYFKSLVNFDISDTGYSLQPRKGFFTTTFKIGSNTYILSNETIYFYDASIGKHIFIDFKQTYTENGLPLIILADFDINNMYLNNASVCTNFDWSSVKTYLESVTIDPSVTLHEVKFVQPKAELAVDKYGIPKYIVKVKYIYKEDGGDERIFEFWVSFVYREKETKYENTTYPANTLVMDYIDFTDTVSINMADRNIASSVSIIPDPMQRVYVEGETLPPDFIQQFPLIYVRIYENNEGLLNYKYLLNTALYNSNLEFIPYFTLDKAPVNYDWYYTYDLISTETSDLNSETVYKSPIYRLEDDQILTMYNYKYSDILNTYNNNNLDINLNHIYDHTTNDSIEDYYNYFNDINIFKNAAKDSFINNSESLSDTAVVYIVPNYSNTKRNTEHTMLDNEVKSIRDFENLFINYEGTDGSFTSIYLKEYDPYYISDTSMANRNSLYYNYHPFISTYTNRLRTRLANATDIDSMLNIMENALKSSNTYITDIDDFMFYLMPLSQINMPYSESVNSTFDGQETFLTNRICAFENTGHTFNEFKKIVKGYKHLIFKMYTTTFQIKIFPEFKDEIMPQAIEQFFPNIKSNLNELSSDEYVIYYIVTDLDKSETLTFSEYYDEDDENSTAAANMRNRLFKSLARFKNNEFYEECSYIPLIEKYSVYNSVSDSTYWDRYIIPYNIPNVQQSNIFVRNDQNNLVASSESISNIDIKYNMQGISMIFYIFKAPKESSNILEYYNYDRPYLTVSTSLKQSRQIIYSSTPPTTMIETLTEEPEDISSATNSLIFRSVQGDHLVLYIDNKLYISEANNQYYFKYAKTFNYPEQIVKVIQYKDTLLVFTTQNLYSVYPIEVTENVESGVDAEGNKQYTQVTTIEYGSLPVLYNLLVNEKYKDAIQVYNQMVLFYSADGQMFMIKPTATIDSNTRFSIQYFNKNANDILLNYTDYIRDRLRYYNYEIDNFIEQALSNINIKVSVSLNNIKIFYCVPGVMTYILVYDIINNRYYVYDTLSFTNVKHLEFIPDGELYIVEHNNQLYFTQPYVIPNQKNNNVDLSYFHSFTPEPILTELDTGIENLNNHLKKRFRDLHIIYKNISAETLEFSLDVFIDNVPIITYINPEIQVQDSMYAVNAVYKTSTLVDLNRQMLDNNNALFDFSQFNSSKILTHKTSIISRGKTIRTKLCFKSDGIYKIQGYGSIYKEHTV